MENREKIEAECVSPDARTTAVKKTRTETHPEIDKAMILWFRQMSLRPDLRIDGCMLLQQAKKFRLKIHPGVTTPTSWIDRFKNRYDIVHVHKAGESGGVDTEGVRHWKEDKLNRILQRYRPSEIYNADETDLFWKLFSDNSLGFTGKTYYGTKNSKSRITVLVGANMDGSVKLSSFVIGKSKRPRVFKNVTVPVEYTANKKTWMTRALFEDWMRKLDKRMRLEGRHSPFCG